MCTGRDCLSLVLPLNSGSHRKLVLLPHVPWGWDHPSEAPSLVLLAGRQCDRDLRGPRFVTTSVLQPVNSGGRFPSWVKLRCRAVSSSARGSRGFGAGSRADCFRGDCQWRMLPAAVAGLLWVRGTQTGLGITLPSPRLASGKRLNRSGPQFPKYMKRPFSGPGSGCGDKPGAAPAQLPSRTAPPPPWPMIGPWRWRPGEGQRSCPLNHRCVCSRFTGWKWKGTS